MTALAKDIPNSGGLFGMLLATMTWGNLGKILLCLVQES